MEQSDIATNIVKALIKAGVVTPQVEHRAVGAITSLIPRNIQYNFKSDTEFLHASLDHHVQTYFTQVMEPMAKAHHSRATQGGRLMKDEEIEEAAFNLTENVVNELGAAYMNHLDRYFGSDGLAAYVFSRIRTNLLEEAVRYNDDYLAQLNRKMAARRTADATASMLNATTK